MSMPRLRTKFPKGWRRGHRWHYVVATGSSGYCYNRESLRKMVELHEGRGFQVEVYRMKRKGWRP